MKPLIVVAITDQEKNSVISAAKPDMVELRVDLFKKQGLEHAITQFKERRKLKIPLLLTVRNQKQEGAQKEFADTKKWEILETLLPLCDWVDIELSSPLCKKTVLLAHKLKKKVVISSHDFKGMQANPETLMKKALSSRADIFKIASMANTPEDLVSMMEFTQKNRKLPIVTMCLGPLGGLSRILLPSNGSRWVYTFINKPTAPGQLDVKTLKSALKIYYP